MKLTIFGAAFPTGILLTQKALAEGHTVTAFTRNPATFPLKHDALTIVSGDALNPSNVENAIQGREAILSTLGPKGKPVAITAPATENILRAMGKYAVKRLVLVSVAGITVPQDKRKADFVANLVKFFLKEAFDDREKQLALLSASSIDWIAVRVPRLTDDPATGKMDVFFGSPFPSLKLTRADLADFMLAQLTSDQWLRQAPIVSNQ